MTIFENVMMTMDDWKCPRCKKKQKFTIQGMYDPYGSKPMIQICEKCEKDFYKWLKKK
jgi:hypothetical protein